EVATARNKKKFNIDRPVTDSRGLFNWQALEAFQSDDYLLKQKILQYLYYRSRNKTQLIVWDNIHLASPTTLKLLHYIAGKISDYPVLILAATTTEKNSNIFFEPGKNEDIILRMSREGLIYKIELNRFRQEDIRQFLNQTLQHTDFNCEFIPLLYKITGGLPSLIHYYIQLMKKYKIIYKEQGIWFNSSEFSETYLLEMAFNSQEQHQTLGRFDYLSDPQKMILYYSALMDKWLDIPLLQSVTNLSRSSLIHHLKQLIDFGYLRLARDGQFYFKSLKLQTSLADMIPLAARKKMYEELAHTLEYNPSGEPDTFIFRLADYYGKSKNKTKAAEYCIQAATNAVKNYAFYEAKHYMENALTAIAEPKTMKERPLVLNLYLQAAWLERTIGHNLKSLEHCEQALRLNKDYKTDQTTLKIFIQQSFAYFNLNEWQQSQELLEKCLQKQALLEPYERVNIHYGLGKIHFELGNLDQAKVFFNNALHHAEKMNSKSMTALIYNSLGVLQNVHNNHMQSIAFYSKAIPIYEALNDQVGLARIYNNIGLTYAGINDWQKANDLYGKSLGFSDVMGLLQLKAITFINRAFALANLNRLDEAMEYSYKAFRLFKRLKDDLGCAEYYKTRGIIEHKLKTFHKSQKYLKKGLELFSKYNNRLGISESLLALGDLELSNQNTKEALSHFEAALKTYQRMGASSKADQLQCKIEFVRDQKYRSKSHELAC
ncbi:MAG: tetratricopeptide repeat protein, partial [Caldithrix sp.]|nr:tetratricopeptide repeat protein [Caldithrix sp.]